MGQMKTLRSNCRWDASALAGYVGRKQNQDTVAPILMTIVRPRNSRMMKRIPQCLVQAFANRKLILVGTVSIPEPLDVDNDYRPMNGQFPVLHLLSPVAFEAGTMPHCLQV
jgi:hypothetical protein